MKSPIYLEPTISYRSIDKAGLTLEPFVQIYFRFHKVSPKDIFKHFAVLVYTEATIYQIDEEFEQNTDKANFESQHLKTLFTILREKNLLDKEIEHEFACGLQYYALENKMCRGESYTFEEVKLANQHKCFDFRVLHRLLYKLRNLPYDENIMQIFCAGEMLADVRDDIEQYEDDVRRNVYNSYHMIVKLYQQDGEKKLREYIQELEQRVQDAIRKAPWRLRAKLNLAYKIFQAIRPMPKIPQPILTNNK